MIRTLFYFFWCTIHDSYGTIKVNRSRKLLKTDWKGKFDKIFTHVISYFANVCVRVVVNVFPLSLFFHFIEYFLDDASNVYVHNGTIWHFEFLCVFQLFMWVLPLYFFRKFHHILCWCLKITRNQVVFLNNFMQVWKTFEMCDILK